MVIDVRADPNVISLPPHVTLEQSAKLFAALAKGDPDRDAVLKQLVRQLAL
jgi:pyruvate dehydrogenase (quinone)